MFAKELIKLKNPKTYQIRGRANSKVYKSFDKNKTYLIKLYPFEINDNRKRLLVEFSTLKFLRKNNIYNVPKPIAMDLQLNIGIYEYINGFQLKNPKKNHISKAINLIKRLKVISELRKNKFQFKASEACLSCQSLINQIDQRIFQISKFYFNKKIKKFIHLRLVPFWKNIKTNNVSNWPLSSRNKNLLTKNQILSPSDFGFHNAIINDNSIKFIDFEYFGLDDPVKLVADFLWHPAMKISINNSKFWIKEMVNIFKKTDKDFEKRLAASLEMYGVRWILIMLKHVSKENIDKIKINYNKRIFERQKFIMSNFDRILKYYYCLDKNVKNIYDL